MLRFTRNSRFAGFLLAVLLPLLLAGCASPSTSALAPEPSTAAPTPACPLTEPVWLTPPDDPHVSNDPVADYYYANADRSILASARWDQTEEFPLQSGKEGNKMGWFRPQGETLEITGRRLDGDSALMDAHVPEGYSTWFQATGLSFPQPGCWEITARAADEELVFVVEVR